MYSLKCYKIFKVKNALVKLYVLSHGKHHLQAT
jgi:hypothetical protein